MIHIIYICLGLILFSSQSRSTVEPAHSVDGASSVEYDAHFKEEEEEAKPLKLEPLKKEHPPFHLGIKKDKDLPPVSINVYLLWEDGHIQQSKPTKPSSHEGHLIYPTHMSDSPNSINTPTNDVIIHVKTKDKPTQFLAIEQFSIPKNRKLTLHLADSLEGNITLSKVPS